MCVFVDQYNFLKISVRKNMYFELHSCYSKGIFCEKKLNFLWLFSAIFCYVIQIWPVGSA